MNLSTEPFIGITILYADDLSIFDNFNWSAYPIDKKITEAEYMALPMSQRIDWTENIAKEGNDGKQIFVLTNDYQFMNLLEHASDKDKFRFYYGDTNQIVTTFIDLRPNPTLAVGEYLFTCSVKRALKGG